MLPLASSSLLLTPASSPWLSRGAKGMLVCTLPDRSRRRLGIPTRALRILGFLRTCRGSARLTQRSGCNTTGRPGGLCHYVVDEAVIIVCPPSIHHGVDLLFTEKRSGTQQRSISRGQNRPSTYELGSSRRTASLLLSIKLAHKLAVWWAR